MLDFSDRTRTGISKLISRCALNLVFVDVGRGHGKDKFHFKWSQCGGESSVALKSMHWKDAYFVSWGRQRWVSFRLDKKIYPPPAGFFFLSGRIPAI